MFFLYKIPVILVLISSVFIYILGYLYFPDTFQQVFLPSNHIWDETIFYQSTLFNLNQLNSYTFFPYIFNSFLNLFIPDKYFPVLLNLIVTGLLLTVLSLLGRYFFCFKRIYNSVYIVMFSITLGWGVTTYTQWFEIISISTMTDPLIYRQYSPSLSLFLFLFGLYLIYYGIENYVYIQILGLSLTVFSYPFYTVFFIIYVGVFYSLNIRLFKTKRGRVFISSFLCFALLWFYMAPDMGDNYKFISGLTYSIDLNYKILLMNGFFFLLGIYFYRIIKSPVERFGIQVLLIGLFSGVVAIHLNLILGYEVQSYHWDMYLLRPIQWTLVFYLAYIRLFRYAHVKKIFLFTLIFSTLFSITTLVSAKNTYSKNFKLLENQLNLIRSYKALELYIPNGRHYTTLDPLLILMSRHLLPNAVLDLPFSGHMKKANSSEILESYIKTIHIHNLKINMVGKLFNENFKRYLDRDKVFNYILFGMDYNDGIYHSLSKPYKEVNVKNIGIHMEERYLSIEKPQYDDFIVINRMQFNDKQIKNILKYRTVKFKDKYIIIAKPHNKDANVF